MGEYVKRSDALQAVGDIHPLDYNGQGIVERIKAIPVADVVERKSASWKGAGLGDYYCSLCNETYSIGAERVHDWHFCPSCGAVMDGGQDE